MKKLLLLLIVPVIIWFGCSNTVVAEFATVKEIKVRLSFEIGVEKQKKSLFPKLMIILLK